MITRRGFGKLAVAGLAGISTGITSCSSNVFSNLLAWIPIGISAIQGIVTVLGSFVPPGALAIIQLVMAAFSDLSATITQYMNDTNPADKATWLAKIRTILNDIVTNFQAFLAQINVSGPLEAIVVGLAQVVLAALAGFLGQLPAPTGAKTLSDTFRVGRGQAVPYTPKLYKSTKPFIADYNAVATSHGHPEIVIH